MKKIIFIIGSLFMSTYLLADSIDCKNPINTRETQICENRALEILKDKINKQVEEISKELIRYMGKKSADEFFKIQKEWLKFVKKQCLHERTLYGRGSIGGITQITCEQYLYKQRIEYLKTSYQSSM